VFVVHGRILGAAVQVGKQTADLMLVEVGIEPNAALRSKELQLVVGARRQAIPQTQTQ
jgi:hypothetical protein